PLDPPGAARSLLRAELRRIALGRIRFQDLHGAPSTKYFTVAVGIGVDAHLFYKLQANSKQRLGMAAYYAKAWQLWFTHPMERFQVECHNPATGEKQNASVTELLAVRIRNFGGVLQELAPGASLDRSDLRVVLCRTSSRFSYLRYVARGLLRANWKVEGIDLVHSNKICCDRAVRADVEPSGPARRIYVEA